MEWRYITDDERTNLFSLIDSNICDRCRAEHNFEDDDGLCCRCDVMEVIETIQDL